LRDTITKPVFKGFVENQSKSYKSYIETSVRSFVKACISKDNDKRYGIPMDMFDSYSDIIEFVYNHEPARDVKLTLSSISKLKNRNTIPRAVPRTPENENFINYVKQNIKHFNSELFFKELSSESIKLKKELRAEMLEKSKDKDENLALIVYDDAKKLVVYDVKKLYLVDSV